MTEPVAYGQGTLDAGIPLILGPDQTTGRVPLPNNAGIMTPEPGNIDRGQVHTWNVAFERRLLWDISLDVAYVAARGRGGYAWLDLNAPTELGTGNAGRPYASRGRFLSIDSWGQRLKTEYNSLQIAVNRPFTHGLMLKGAYTMSKAMDQSDADGRTGFSWNTPSEFHRNWARAGFDRTHNLQLGVVYRLPWQTNDSYTSVARALINDWQLNGVLAAFSGTPFTVTASGTQLNTPGNTQTADIIGNFGVSGDIGTTGTWFETGAFSQPTGIRFGNTGRNQFRGPAAWNLDLSVFRVFPIGGARRLEFRAEAGNVLNHPVFGNPSSSITSGTFGRITGTGGGGSYPERQVRLGVRVSF